MARIFISYRRQDSQSVAGRIHDHLVAVFGRNNIFKDVDRIPPGSDFVTVLQNAVRASDVMLVLIGPQWASITGKSGQLRLADPGDFVRMEVEMALQHSGVRVIPVLVMGAHMPGLEQLPSPVLKQLGRRNAVTVRDDPDFHRDIGRLIGHIKLLTSKTADPPRRDWVTIVLAILALLATITIAVVLLAALSTRSGGGTSPNTPHPLTEIAFSNATSAVLAQTATADAWTDTPTATHMPTMTPTEPPDLTATYQWFETIAAITNATNAPPTNSPDHTPSSLPLFPVLIGIVGIFASVSAVAYRMWRRQQAENPLRGVLTISLGGGLGGPPFAQILLSKLNRHTYRLRKRDGLPAPFNLITVSTLNIPENSENMIVHIQDVRLGGQTAANFTPARLSPGGKLLVVNENDLQDQYYIGVETGFDNFM